MRSAGKLLMLLSLVGLLFCGALFLLPPSPSRDPFQLSVAFFFVGAGSLLLGVVGLLVWIFGRGPLK